MTRILNYITCFFLGAMFLWYADRVFNDGIPAPHHEWVWLHEALLTWMVLVLWNKR